MIFKIFMKHRQFNIEEIDKKMDHHFDSPDDVISQILNLPETLKYCSFDIGTKTIDETYKLISDAMYAAILKYEKTRLVSKYNVTVAKCIVNFMHGRVKCLGYVAANPSWNSLLYSLYSKPIAGYSEAILVTDNSEVSLNNTEMAYNKNDKAIFGIVNLKGRDIVTKIYPLTSENLRKCVNIDGNNIHEIVSIAEELLKNYDTRIDKLREDIDQMQSRLEKIQELEENTTLKKDLLKLPNVVSIQKVVDGKNQKMKELKTLRKTLYESLSDEEKLLVELNA